MIDNIQLNAPLSVHEVLQMIGFIAEKMPYNNGEGIAAKALCQDIASKCQNAIIEVPIKAVDILVKLVDYERIKGNDIAIHDIEQLIKLLKGGVDRHIVGIMLKGLSAGKFIQQDDGSLKTEVVVKGVLS